MRKIETLKNGSGKSFYPLTSTKAVVDENGNTIEDRLVVADGEDLVTDGNVLRLKDRPNTDGMGYVILRKNKTFQEQVTKPNTIYEIRYDFDLGRQELPVVLNTPFVLPSTGGAYYRTGDYINVEAGMTVDLPSGGVLFDSTLSALIPAPYTPSSKSSLYVGKLQSEAALGQSCVYSLHKDVVIPENCVLKFEGGSLGNGSIIGQNSILCAKEVSIFKGIKILGEWRVTNIYSTWFADIEEDNCLKNLMALSSDNYYNYIFIKEGNYIVSTPTREERFCLNLTSNTKLHFNGTIILTANNLASYSILRVDGKTNVIISGSGTIIGDKHIHTGTEGEWGHGISISNGCTNVEVNGITIKDCWGDCLVIDGDIVNTNIKVKSFNFDNGRRQGISVIFADDVKISNGIITNIYGTPPSAAIDIESNSNGYCKNITISNIKINSKIGIMTSQAPSTFERMDINNVFIKDCNIVATDYCLDFIAGQDINVKNCNLIHYNENAEYTVTCESGSFGVIFNDCKIDSKAKSLFYVGSRTNDFILKNSVINCVKLGYFDTKPNISNNTITCSEKLFYRQSNETIIKNNTIKVPELMGESSTQTVAYIGNTIDCEGDIRCRTKDFTFSNNIIKCNFLSFNALGLVTGNTITCDTLDVNLDVLMANNTIKAGYAYLKKGKYIGNNFFNIKEAEYEHFLRIEDVDFQGNIVDIVRESGTTPFLYIYASSKMAICSNNKFKDSDFITAIYYSGHNGSSFINNIYDTNKSVYLPSEANSRFIDPNVGTSRPTLKPANVGSVFFDISMNKPIWWTGTAWVEGDNQAAGIKRAGIWSQRPNADGSYLENGFQYFLLESEPDEDPDGNPMESTTGNGKPIWWIQDGRKWVDALGNTITGSLGITKVNEVRHLINGEEYKFLTTDEESKTATIYAPTQIESDGYIVAAQSGKAQFVDPADIGLK